MSQPDQAEAIRDGGLAKLPAQALLQLCDERTLDLNIVIANTSVTRVLYSGSRRSLEMFNNDSHLEAENPALITFR